jgi:hypothetical protein
MRGRKKEDKRKKKQTKERPPCGGLSFGGLCRYWLGIKMFR